MFMRQVILLCIFSASSCGHASGFKPPLVTFTMQSPGAVIDIRRTPGTEDNMFGFEGGRVVHENGTYWYFTAEMFGLPVDANMRVAIWRASRILGPWRRVTTIMQSQYSYPQTKFVQQCNQDYCQWKNASADTFRMLIEYHCNTSELLGAPWAPFPIFDDAEDRWHVLYVSYMCDGTWMVSAGGGNIMGARSAAPGRAGIEGPYDTYGIVIGPNASDPAKRWGSINHADFGYVDQISPYRLPNGTYAAFIGEFFSLALAASPAGPWHVGESYPHAIHTASSDYNENPVVTEFQRPDGKITYAAVFDTVQSEAKGFGITWSQDGITWTPGIDIPMPGTIGVRTPLGLIDQGNGKAAMLFTRRFADCNNQSMLPANGADAISPSSCANVYAAFFDVDWTTSDGFADEAKEPQLLESSIAVAREHMQTVWSLQKHLEQLDRERTEVQRLLSNLEAGMAEGALGIKSGRQTNVDFDAII